MNRKELRDLARERLRDTRKPPTWADATLDAFLEAAVLEACERARLIPDRNESDFTTIPLTADVTAYDLDPSIQVIERAWTVTPSLLDFAGNPAHTELPATTPEELFVRVGSTWQIHRGPPQRLWVDEKRLHIYPIPSSSDFTLHLWVYRRPVESERMASDADEPPIASAHHRRLVDWVLFEAYSQHDADVFDKTAAERHYAAFERHFGPRPTARNERYARNKVAGSPVYTRRFGGL